MLKDKEQFNQDPMRQFPELYAQQDGVDKHIKKKPKRNNKQEQHPKAVSKRKQSKLPIAKSKSACKNAARKEKKRSKKAKKKTQGLSISSLM
mmetsp:Transcript_30297/g.55353  ORF Transcript_30297/g.55353 Transcript_30297/m.55353 type:complete len:92 (+) Transcript_30297:412-687(+)